MGVFGLKGMVKIASMTDFPERFEVGATIIVQGVPRKIERTQWHKNQVRVLLEGISKTEAAEALKWEYVSVPEGDRPELDEGEFLVSDLLGMFVFEESGEELGQVDEIMDSPAHEILVVGEVLIPLVEEFVTEIDVESNKITVRLIPGMRPTDPEETD